MQFLPIKRAVLSVTDKTDVVKFARFLAGKGVQLFSTGGTEKVLVESYLPVSSVSNITNTPEMLDGRVKTLHPNVYAGILAEKTNEEHMATLRKYSIAPIDLVCVNLYNFADAISKKLELPQVIESIDIGGPCMLRAAAKNFSSVTVVPGPQWYAAVMEDLVANDMKVSLELRRTLAYETFKITSAYDTMIVEYLAQ